MMKRAVTLFCIVIGSWLCSPHAFGSVATFTPLGSTSVDAGQVVEFDIQLTAETIAGIDTVDVVIGSDGATSLQFSYDLSFTSAFQNVSTPTYDNGFYSHDVFVGGNNPSSVGLTVNLGRVTLGTAGMSPGVYAVSVDFGRDGVSTVGSNGTPDAIAGTASFEILKPIPAVSTWGLTCLALLLLSAATLLIQRTTNRGNPEQSDQLLPPRWHQPAGLPDSTPG